MIMIGDNKKKLKEVAHGILGEGRSLRIPAEGYSMYPAIKPGNIILINPVNDPAILKPGDIIAWTRDSDLVVHRLIRISERKGEKRFVTCGDISITNDKPISTARIAGKVEYAEDSGQLVKLKSNIPTEWRRKINRNKVKVIRLLKRLGLRN